MNQLNTSNLSLPGLVGLLAVCAAGLALLVAYWLR